MSAACVVHLWTHCPTQPCPLLHLTGTALLMDDQAHHAILSGHASTFPSSTLYLQEPQHRRSCLSRSGNLEVLLPQEAALPLITLLQCSKSMASVPGPCQQSCSDPPPGYVAACRLWLMTKTAAPGFGLFLRAAAFDSLQRREDE